MNVDQSHADYIDYVDSIDSLDIDSSVLNPDVHFFVMLRYGLLALQLLPENCISGMHILLKLIFAHISPYLNKLVLCLSQFCCICLVDMLPFITHFYQFCKISWCSY